MLFGTNGVRGKFSELNPELAVKLSQAIGIYFGRGKILVARDGRLTGECLKNAVISGLQSVGCEVIDLDYASAPTAEFSLKKLNGDGLIIITASHNPPEWNALKVVDKNGVTVSRERGEKIEKLMSTISICNWDQVKPSKRYPQATMEHIEAIKKFLKPEKFKNLKVVLDCGNGMAALIAPKLFRELGCEIVTLNSNVDGNFPGRPSEPSESNLNDLKKSVISLGAACGIAWDGDGDRVVLIDEKGQFIVGDKVYAISVIIKLAEKKGNFVTTVATSKCIQDLVEAGGCKLIYTKIGAPYLSEEFLHGKAIMGGEEVGGVIWPEISLAKDGFMTAAKIVELLSDKKLSVLLDSVPAYFNQKIKIEANDEKKVRIMESAKVYAKKNRLKVTDIDGIRVDFKDSWVIIRPSGTENYIRIFAEAKTNAQALQLIDEYKKAVL